MNKDVGHSLNSMKNNHGPNWEQMPGEWTIMEHVDNKVVPRHYVPNIIKSTKMHESITVQTNFVLGKIEAKTITVGDINKLISESLPSSVVDRVNRRTTRNPDDSHVDNKTGNQPLSPVPKRPGPKRQPSNKTKSYGRAKQARRKSARTEKRKAGKYTEVIEFINKFIGTSVDDYGESFNNLQNKDALFEVTTRLLRDDDVNRDWMWEIRESISEN